MKTRIFNRIHVDYFNQTVLKSSSNKSKLRDEVNYYLNLPNELAIYFPNVLSYRRDYSAYRLELVPYQSLSDLILNDKISYQEGTEIIDHLLFVLDKMQSYNQENNNGESLSEFCIKKTLSRVKDLNKLNFFENFSKIEFFEINNKKMANFNHIKMISSKL